jgi:hypothetical protein
MTSLLVLAGLVLAVIVMVAPKASVTTNHASTEIIGIDVLGLTKSAKDLPAQQFAAH